MTEVISNGMDRQIGTNLMLFEEGYIPMVESNLPMGISIVNIDNVRHFPDLNGVIDSIHHETGTLLQPSIESLENSFADRKAVVLLDQERAVGYVRLSSLLDADKKEAIGLPGDFPDITETGSAIIHPKLRGHGYYPKMRTELLSMFSEEMREGKMLILGTTKNPRVIESLDDSVDRTGMEFQIVSRHEIPMIAPFTCVCQGEFGRGFQEGASCHQEPTPNQLVQITEHKWEDVRKNGNGKIPCTLYVSDLDLANEMGIFLYSHYGSQENLVEALKMVGQYE
jgi:hypothetical protein